MTFPPCLFHILPLWFVYGTEFLPMYGTACRLINMDIHLGTYGRFGKLCLTLRIYQEDPASLKGR